MDNSLLDLANQNSNQSPVNNAQAHPFLGALDTLSQIAASTYRPPTVLGRDVGIQPTPFQQGLGGLAQGYNIVKQNQDRHNFYQSAQTIVSSKSATPQDKKMAMLNLIMQHGGNDYEGGKLKDMLMKDLGQEGQPVYTTDPQTNKPVLVGNVPKGSKFVKTANSSTAGIIQIPPGLQALPDNATPEAKQLFLSHFDSPTQTLIKGLADYSLSPTQTSSLFRSNARQATLEAAKMYDPSFDMKKYQARQRYQTDLASARRGTAGGNVLALNTLMGHVQLLQNMVAPLQNKSMTPVNAVILAARKMAGDPSIVNYEEAQAVVDSELENALTGVGATQEGLKIRREMANKNMSPSQMVGMINTIKEIAATRLKNLTSQYKAVMGKEPPVGLFVYPDNVQQFSEGAGGPPQAQGKSVVKTGMYNGRKVVQYSDGSVAYQ